MAQLSNDRNTPELATPDSTLSAGAAGAHPFYFGQMVGIGLDDGLIKPFSASMVMKGVGVSQETKTVTVHGSGTIQFKTGIFRFDNSSSDDAIANKDKGNFCFGSDDHTVAKTSATSTRSRAGWVHSIDSLGVWVKFDGTTLPSGSTP